MNKGTWIVFFCMTLLPGGVLYGQTIEDAAEAQRRQKIDELIAECQMGRSQAAVCLMILELKQLGDDAVETVKALVPLGPFEYFVLTALNFATTGRLRAQLQPFIHPRVKNTLEYRVAGEWWILLSYQF